MLFGKHINRYYIKYLLPLLLGILALLVVDYFQLVIPELYGELIDGIRQGSVGGIPFDMEYLLDEICLPLVWVVVALVTGRFLWRICIFGTATAVSNDLRLKMFSHVKDLSQNYYQRNKVGGIMALFTNDLETVQDCFSNGVLMTFDAALLGVLAVSKMSTMSYNLTLLCLFPMVLLMIIGVILGRSMKNKFRRKQEAYSAISDFTQENFSGIAVVKAFVNELRELLFFKKLNRENEDAAVSHTMTSATLGILVTLFVQAVTCIILGYGGYLVYVGEFTTGELIEFMSYFSSIVWPVMAVSHLIEMHSRGAASVARIGQLLDAQIDVFDGEGVSALPEIRGNIELRSLTFRYPGADYDAISDISLTVNEGESLGIIGRTGAGKTTVCDLLLRLYNLPRGMLFFDGIDVNDIPISQIRENIAFVPQDNFLFSDTIENNIAFSSGKPDKDEVERVATLAAVHDNIAAFSNGYKTVLGERGVTVSGGQKQRISIARALMKNAPVLVLDDSVSAVDTDTERAIMENLKLKRAGKTTILVAHRVSTVRYMDKIAFLDEGRLLGFGTHEQLVATCPEYRKTVELQRLEDEGVKSDV